MNGEAALGVYFSLIFARVATFVAVMPLFSGRVPRTVRAVLALVLAVFYFARVMPDWSGDISGQQLHVSSVAFALAMCREAVLGAAMGFAFGLFLLPARVAGEFITSQIGLALSPQSGFVETQPAGPYALIFETIAALVFFEMDLHHIVFQALSASFIKLPLGGDLLPNATGPALDGLARSHESGLLLIGPLAMCLFLLAVVLAIMARAAPQLNIYTVGFSLQVFVALAGAMFLMPDMIRSLTHFLGRTAEDVSRYFG